MLFTGKLPFHLRMIRGSIGKKYCVKHYKGEKVVLTRYPNMKGVVASEKQKIGRRLFRKAVLYTQKIYGNAVLKEEKRKLLRRPKRLFQALMKEWFKRREEKKFWNERKARRWQRRLVIENNSLFFGLLVSIQCRHRIRKQKVPL
ncbi:MAG: hypothetical protein C4329_09350 [Chitinophagaceae bacterium]